MMLDLVFATGLHRAAAAILIVGVLTLWFAGRRGPRHAGAIFSAGAIVLITEATVRGLVTQRLPVVGTYENTLVVAAMIATACALISFRSTMHIRAKLLALVAPWALAALAYGSLFSAEPISVGIEGRGMLAYAHALVGWLDFTVLLVASMSAVGMLLDRKTDPQVWQPVLARTFAAGFVGLTATMATGALLSFAVFGSWYQWQIVETLAAVLWLAYGLAIHALLMFGWRHKRLAVVAVSLLPLTLLTFWSWSIFANTYHYFERLL